MPNDNLLVRITVPQGVRVLVVYEGGPALPPRTIETTAEEAPPSSGPGVSKARQRRPLLLVGKAV